MARRPGALLAVLAVAGLLFGTGIATGKSGSSSKGRKALFADMLGSKEVGTNGKKGAGDPNGFGSFTAIVAGNKLCFGIVVRGIDTPVAAHIHKGSPSVSGGIVVTLTAPSAGDPGAASACVTADAKTLAAIQKNPSKYYVNVHTGTFPGGALRGQLRKR